MSKSVPFNATDWFSQTTFGGTQLSAKTQGAVADFTMMWNFFEGTLCGNKASLQTFRHILRSFQATQLHQSTSDTLDNCLSFWKSRYWNSGAFNQRFEKLCFRPNDQRPHVEAVLSGTATTPEDKLFALMIIVYRLRNNLFHGLKSLDILNDQVENLNNASLCLAAILEAIPSPLVLSPTAASLTR